MPKQYPKRMLVLLNASALLLLSACGQGGGGSAAPPQQGGQPHQAEQSDAPPPTGEVFTNSLGMELRRIESGTFVMGGSGGPAHQIEYLQDEGRGHAVLGALGDDATDFNTPAHEVEIERPFYIGVTEVTQAQYEAVMGENPSLVKDSDLPVFMIDWYEAKAFCEKLSELEGRTYRLPTEAEWEYACRAGTTTRFFWGDDPEVADQYARFTPGEYTSRALAGDAGYGPDPVGSYEPNPWGLYDMYGNVSEWCLDETYYYTDSSREREIPPGEYRINRGSAWSQNVAMLGSALRSYAPSNTGINTFGFRIVLEVE